MDFLWIALVVALAALVGALRVSQGVREQARRLKLLDGALRAAEPPERI